MRARYVSLGLSFFGELGLTTIHKETTGAMKETHDAVQ